MPKEQRDQLGGTASTAKLCFLPSQALLVRQLLLNFNTGIMEGGTGDRTTREVNLDRLRPRGVKRRLTTENDASTKVVNRVRRKRQKGQQPEEEEEVEEDDEVDEDGREEMERLVGLVPSLMGREGSVSQVRPGISEVKLFYFCFIQLRA